MILNLLYITIAQQKFHLHHFIFYDLTIYILQLLDDVLLKLKLTFNQISISMSFMLNEYELS